MTIPTLIGSAPFKFSVPREGTTCPPRVDYALTPLGRTLRHTVDDLVAWVEHHVGEIELAKASYDGRMRTRGVLPKSRLTDQSINLKKFQGG